MTRGQIKTTARKKLGEATAVFFTEADLDQWFTDGCIDVVWKTMCNQKRSLVTTIAVTADPEVVYRYTLTSLVPNCLKIISARIWSSDVLQWRRLTEKTYDFLDQTYPQWESYTPATPLYYVYSRPVNEFILFPSAQADYVGTGFLELYSSTYPTVLTLDSQVPTEIPTMLQQAITEWMVATGLEARGYQDIADNHWQKYEQKLVSYLSVTNTEPDEEICMHAG